jgi:hypothetical protein
MFGQALACHPPPGMPPMLPPMVCYSLMLLNLSQTTTQMGVLRSPLSPLCVAAGVGGSMGYLIAWHARVVPNHSGPMRDDWAEGHAGRRTGT